MISFAEQLPRTSYLDHNCFVEERYFKGKAARRFHNAFSFGILLCKEKANSKVLKIFTSSVEAYK